MSTSDANRKSRPKSRPIQDLTQLLRAVYTGAFKRSALKKTELTAIRDAPRLGTDEQELLNLASSDRTLERTLKLMLFGEGLDVPVIANQIRAFVAQVLQRHPAFGTRSLEKALNDIEAGSSEHDGIQELIYRDYSSLIWTKETEQLKPLTKKELDQCKSNAVNCLLLRFRVTRGISAERIQQHLQEHLWKSVSRRYKGETDRLRVLMTTRDSAAASVAFSMVENQALEQRRRAEDAHRAGERAKLHAMDLKEKLDESKRKLMEIRARVSCLEEELKQEIQTRANERTYLKDDYEKLRGQVLRRLKAELSLLDDGLHALRREPPKIHVMVDHAERAIDGLKQEMERLRRNG